MVPLELIGAMCSPTVGGGQICPQDFQMLIPQEPKVGLTSNQAVNSSLSVVSRSKKKDGLKTLDFA